MPYRLSGEDKNMITVEHICKTYRVAQRNSGLWAAFSSLFHREYETIHALEDISFHIREMRLILQELFAKNSVLRPLSR